MDTILDMKLMKFGIYFNVADQVHIVNKKASTKHNDISKHALLEPKKTSKALRQEIFD